MFKITEKIHVIIKLNVFVIHEKCLFLNHCFAKLTNSLSKKKVCSNEKRERLLLFNCLSIT